MTLRSDLNTAVAKSDKKTKAKKKKRVAGVVDWLKGIVDDSPGKKQKRKIDDILDQDPYAPKKKKETEDS